MLGQVADPLPNGDAVGDDVVVKNRPGSIGWVRQPQQDFHRRRFASAIRTQETKNGMARHAQVDGLKGLHIPKAFAQCLGLDSVVMIRGHS